MKKSQADDDLLQIGAEGKAGDEAFKQYAKQKDKESKEKRDSVVQMIEDAPKRRESYNAFIADLLVGRLKTIDWGVGWKCNVAPTKIGVIMEIKSPEGRIFRSAFKTVAEGIYDLNAVDTFALMAENTIDQYHQYNSGGIWTPNQQKMNL